ncbi:MAG: GH32 C-terminal domain-containing protein [Verrucomicrobia bacterium]|nr:GH32 C-terminal domain-containing protein [Verrucomicrobiota bacterium]
MQMNRWRIGLLAILIVSACLQQSGTAMIFRPEKGAMWDPSILWHNGKYHAFMMYNKKGDNGLDAGHCLLATSADGVHWEDQGAIIDERGRPDGATFFKCFVAKCGDKFVMDHGVLRQQGQDLMRFYQSKDLRNWNYITSTEPDGRWYSRERWDHMYMLPKEEGKPEAGYWGYIVAVSKEQNHLPAMMESRDGTKWEALPPAKIEWGATPPRNCLEYGGCERINGKYYLIGGVNEYMGNKGYCMYTFVADNPRGPFRPDAEAFRLCGNSGKFVAWLAAWARGKDELLISNYASMQHGEKAPWMLPLRKPVVDKDGHLRMGWWKGNEALKGRPLTIDNKKVMLNGEGKQGNYDVFYLDETINAGQGIILEGSLGARASAQGDKGTAKPVVGFVIEEKAGQATAIQLGIGKPEGRETHIGRLITAPDGTRTFSSEDVTGKGCATVTGVEDGREHTFRLLCRKEMFELYIDDLLVQTYTRPPGSGKVGFLVGNAQAEFSGLSAWAMSFPAEGVAKISKPKDNPAAKYRAVIKSQDKAVFSKAALELRRWMEIHDPQRPTYHTMGPLDFTFDVNGPIYHDGKYHIFYLNDKNPDGCRRGHLVSKDLVRWEDWPVAMWPDTPWDREAVFSGNLVIDDKGTPTFIYTGNSSHQTAKGVMARSDDGMLTWQKKLVMDKPPYPGTPVHWDGQLWKDGGTWYQLCGGKFANGGAAVLWSSPNLENWTYRNRIYTTGKYGDFWELPYLLPFGEKSVLIIGVCPVRYWVGVYDKTSFVFKPDKEEAEILDVSPHFYAPNPHMVDDKGPGGSQRRLMFGWVRGGQTPTKEVPYWDGNHSIPRVLTLDAGKLIQEPIPELQLLRHGHLQLKDRTIESFAPGLLKDLTGKALEIVASFDPKGATAKRFGVKLRMSKDGKEQTVVYYEPATSRFGVAGSVVDGEISDKADFPAGQRITLHIFLDRSVVEVFAAGRAITKRVYSDPTSQGLDAFSDGGSVKLDTLDVWRMKSIWD